MLHYHYSRRRCFVMPEMLKDSRRKFLEHFPESKRSTVANNFLWVIRKGITDPEIVLTEVFEKARLQEDKRYITDAIYKFMSEAVDYIKYLLDWEDLPDSEKQYYKKIQAKKAVRFFMNKDMPTEKQMSYLKALGYTGRPTESKGEASDLIATIKVFKKFK